MKKLLLIALVLTSSAAMANYTTCNDLGDIQICRDSSGYTSTTHQIGNSYITNGSDGYRSTTHQIGSDIYQGQDNRGNSWNIYNNIRNNY
ncbi:hypothetical protein EUX48_02745 [Haemophilus haemolyticus]|uniref:Uncharacterized protein n=1 Tax=Haemophilus haemolyticus TaxID=726 RepID=A0A502LKI5_HAEHA|nr:hypothetical protein [Haemophilus haemolyticus]TPH24516.1 hypothetical protein EUX48_02745 [Haemophilus haemolyticus]